MWISIKKGVEALTSLFRLGVTVPHPPSDGEVKKVADKLALFVAKNGRQFEDITRQKNPGNSPFRFSLMLQLKLYSYKASMVYAELLFLDDLALRESGF